MEISHVIRGEEWLPSLALHYQLYNAFGWDTPEFAALIEAFDLKKVNKSGARFDPDKTKWFNHQYMQEQHNDVLAEAFKNENDQLRT